MNTEEQEMKYLKIYFQAIAYPFYPRFSFVFALKQNSTFIESIKKIRTKRKRKYLFMIYQIVKVSISIVVFFPNAQINKDNYEEKKKAR